MRVFLITVIVIVIVTILSLWIAYDLKTRRDCKSYMDSLPNNAPEKISLHLNAGYESCLKQRGLWYTPESL